MFWTGVMYVLYLSQLKSFDNIKTDDFVLMEKTRLLA